MPETWSNLEEKDIVLGSLVSLREAVQSFATAILLGRNEKNASQETGQVSSRDPSDEAVQTAGTLVVASSLSRALPCQAHHAFRVTFFDLDDTLIPTDWVRRAFAEARRQKLQQDAMASASAYPWQSPGLRHVWGTSTVSDTTTTAPISIGEALCPTMQSIVRKELERIGGRDFDEHAAALIEAACQTFGVVVIVTNARSSAWLQTASHLFPRFKSQLRRFSVPILRAAATTSRTAFRAGDDYFHYWTQLKKLQFTRVAAVAVQLLATLRTGGKAKHAYSGSTKKLPGAARHTTTTTTTNRPAPHERPCSEWLLSLSPRGHQRERKEIEALLSANERNWMVPLDSDALRKILGHQLQRFFAHDSSQYHQALLEMFRCMEPSRIPELDIVCIGDSEFELCAARELAEMNHDIFRRCGLIKCRAGLSPDQFRVQLHHIEEALRCMASSADLETTPRLCQFGSTVLVEHTSRQCGFTTYRIGSWPLVSSTTGSQRGRLYDGGCRIALRSPSSALTTSCKTTTTKTLASSVLIAKKPDVTHPSILQKTNLSLEDFFCSTDYPLTPVASAESTPTPAPLNDNRFPS